MKRLVCLCLLGLLVTFEATAAPLYHIVPLGLDDPEHTRNDGYKLSAANGLTEAGQVSGISERYNGGSTYLGQNAWIYNGATTIDIGLTGSEHTRNDGYKSSSASQLNDAGQVIGVSQRYNGGSIPLGQTAWLYDGVIKIDIGLTGSEHTSSNGRKYSYVEQLNEVGQVRGYSYRYNGGSVDLGRSAWVYDGATTTAIGFTGAEHTRNDGYKASYNYDDLNEAGQVIGASERYNGGSTHLGESAWLYDGATTIDIGLTGNEHTRSDGYKESYAVRLNAAGQVLGRSSRYNGGGANLGFSGWLYDGTTTIDFSLTGAEYTRSDGYRFTQTTELNETGQVLGVSDRYNGGSTWLSRDAWFYNGATTIGIGFTGAEHTRNDGYKESVAFLLNEAGQVNGWSLRYNGGSTELGFSAWRYDGAATIELGLTGTEYTRSDGYKLSSARALNEAGQVIGSSPRYSGDIELGQDAWFYDPTLHQTIPLRFSTRSDGYAYSEVYYLGKDGLVLGIYTLFDALDTDLGSRAFYFSVADGLHDLGALVDGGLAASGWDYLNGGGYYANGHGQIITWGRTSGGQIAYGLLTPAVPEPSSLALTAAGLLGFTLHRRGTFA